ncbi:MAG TPA: aldehyde dehydrogenase [Caulobacteraceae bacterium]|nr:aldehyde dehydrogenase [Caulobacteraceae bacterium]
MDAALTDPQAVGAYPVRERHGSFIGGAPGDAAGGFEIPVIDPATEAVVSVLREDDAVDVDRAVAAARDAFDNGPWPRMEIGERKAVLRKALAHVAAHAEELAWLECIETGVPLWDIRGRKIARVVETFEFFMEVAGGMAGETFQQNSKYLTYVTHEPVGVVAGLAPWNSPMSLGAMQVAPAIAFGNTCVLKPSEHTPMALYRLVQLLNEGGLPPGVVNLVNGRGPVTGEALVAHKGVDLVKFVGGTETGRHIMAAAAKGLKKVGLELGGKSANLVFADADPDEALDGALLGIFSNNGQQCLAGSRILVQRQIADDFIARFVERARNIRVGDPLDPKTEMGPLAFRQHYERVLSYVDVARADGAKLLVGGTRAPGFDKGYYVSPTAVLAPDNDARVCREEIFGPFATFLVFDTAEDAIRIANQSSFGLVAYLWSTDIRKVMQVSQAVRAGTVWVNTPLTRELRAPFGGYKESGLGRDSAKDSIEFFTEKKTTTIPVGKLAIRKMGAD